MKSAKDDGLAMNVPQKTKVFERCRVFYCFCLAKKHVRFML